LFLRRAEEVLSDGVDNIKTIVCSGGGLSVPVVGSGVRGGLVFNDGILFDVCLEFLIAEGYGLVDFVGHPLLDEIEKDNFSFSLQINKPIIALLPGSRKQEISKILPQMLGVVSDFPDYQFVVATTNSVEEDFYKILFHRFPNAKFILFTRDANKWFDSMANHSYGKTLGNTFRHVKNYRREIEFYEKYTNQNYYENLHVIDNLLDLNESHREHYTSIYRRRNKEVIDFFNYVSPKSLFVGKLEDPDKWQKLGGFFNLTVPKDYSVHSNKTNK
jgi:hypothetical protein